MKNVPVSTTVLLAIVSGLISGGAGYYFGKQSEPNSMPVEMVETAESGATESADDGVKKKAIDAESVVQPKQKEASQPVRLTPQQLAASKGVKARISREDGVYTLVSVVEGEQGNVLLTRNLQLVSAQRQRLGELAKQYDSTPASAVQQRELLAGQINQANVRLNQDLQAMAKTYGYSLSNTYLLVPHLVHLTLTEKVNEKVEAKLIHEFNTPESFESFQAKTREYTGLKQKLSPLEKSATEAAAAEAFAEASGEDAKAKKKAAADNAKQLAQVKKQLATMREKFLKEFGFDPEKQHRLVWQKSVLYAKPVR